MTYTSKKWQCISPAAAMHSFGTLQHRCCLQSTWLPWSYTLPLILRGNCYCMICEIRTEAEGLRWHFGFYSLTDPFFPFHCQILHHCLFLSSPFTALNFLFFLPTVIPSVASAGACQIGSPGAHLVCSAAAKASASTSDLFWPCPGLCSTKSCSYL